jgi:site-specific recombinase XerD
MFRSESPRKSGANAPMANWSFNRILKGIASELDLSIRMSTHTLRKTFCYHQMLMSHNDPRKLMLLQKMLNHSSPAQTLDYIGITAEEFDDAYNRLNLGSAKYNYLVNSSIGEQDEVIA